MKAKRQNENEKLNDMNAWMVTTLFKWYHHNEIGILDALWSIALWPAFLSNNSDNLCIFKVENLRFSNVENEKLFHVPAMPFHT